MLFSLCVFFLIHFIRLFLAVSMLYCQETDKRKLIYSIRIALTAIQLTNNLNRIPNNKHVLFVRFFVVARAKISLWLEIVCTKIAPTKEFKPLECTAKEQKWNKIAIWVSFFYVSQWIRVHQTRIYFFCARESIQINCIQFAIEMILFLFLSFNSIPLWNRKWW